MESRESELGKVGRGEWSCWWKVAVAVEVAVAVVVAVVRVEVVVEVGVAVGVVRRPAPLPVDPLPLHPGPVVGLGRSRCARCAGL